MTRSGDESLYLDLYGGALGKNNPVRAWLGYGSVYGVSRVHHRLTYVPDPKRFERN